MSDVVNLNKARKAKAKQSQAAKAAQNRILHGLSAEKRMHMRLMNSQDSKKLANHVLITTQPTKTIDGDQ